MRPYKSRHGASGSHNEIRDTASPRRHLGSGFRRSGYRHPYPKDYQFSRKDYIYILILGPSGSGKSSLINMVSDDKQPVASQGMGLCTTGFRFSQQVIGSKPFRLIDSPGFNTDSRTNADIFGQLVSYLSHIHEKMEAKVAGIVYLHPEGRDPSVDKLHQNLDVIKRLFGGNWLQHVTVAVVGPDTPDIETASLSQDPTSPLDTLHAEGARIRHITLQSKPILELLLELDQETPQEAMIYSKTKDNHGAIDRDESNKLIEEVLGIQPVDSTNGIARRLPRPSLEESEASRQHLQLALTAAEEELQSLRSQLEQTRLEYGSLRSELQIHDNTEQNKVVQYLKDLNRRVEGFSRVVAQHLVDNYIEGHIEKGVTALDALNLSDLRVQFRHEDGASSLVSSSSGAGMPVEDFIDLALRTIICRRLYESIFLPFHPMIITAPEATFMASLYEEVRHHAPQTIAAKWRANSFIALSKGKGSEARAETIENQVEDIMNNGIARLIDNYFGQEKSITLTEQQHERLKEIVAFAWQWNDVLKGDVIMLGDFQATFHESGSPFETQNMLEFESNERRGSPPRTAICTIGLGLSLSHYKAGCEGSGPLTVCKAVVVTENFYTIS